MGTRGYTRLIQITHRPDDRLSYGAKKISYGFENAGWLPLSQLLGR